MIVNPGGAHPESEPATSKPVVLFYTDNGLGLGHLTRQAAVASRAQGRFQPLFLTMSAGFVLLKGLGIPGEYFPSYGRLGIARDQWEPLILERLLEAIHLTGATVVVVDHVSPPRILNSVRNNVEGVRFVWSRRGLWQPGKNRGALQLSDGFDLVVEPGDIASPIDQGSTVEGRKDAISIGPVVLTDPDEFLPRDQARASLGIPETGRAVLVSLGDASPAEVGNLISHTRSVVDQVAPDHVHLFAPLHPLHGGQIPPTEGVIMAPVYPIARHFKAFDGAISTAGYNSFHEIVGGGLPAVFVPHRGASIDDQRRRAEFGALCGRAHWAPDVYDEMFPRAVAKMLRPREARIAQETTSALGEMKGAHEFATLLAELASGSEGAVVDTQSAHNSFPTEPTTTLIDAVDSNDAELGGLAEELDPADTGTTIILVRDGDPGALYDRGFVFESLVTNREWGSLGTGDYAQYVESRIAGITDRYNVARIIAPRPGRKRQSGEQQRSAG